MAVVAIVMLRAEFCRACNGKGHRMLLQNGIVHTQAACPDCNGTGDVPADYFIEVGTAAQVDEAVDRLLQDI